MTAQTVAIVTTSFPAELNFDAILPEGVQGHRVAGVRELGAEPAVSAVLLFAGSTSGATCPALHELLLLRTSRAIPASLRNTPAFILSDYSAEDLLRFDPAFLPFVSPGTAVLSPPFTRQRLAEGLGGIGPASPGEVVRYLDIEGQLANLRDRARHRVANALGPQVLTESARAAGVINADRARQVGDRLARLGSADPVAADYAELLSVVRARPAAAAAKGPTLDLQKERLSALLLDDDRTGGWPEALAAVLLLGESAPVRPDLPGRGFARGTFRLDCWSGTDLEACLQALCPAVAPGEHVRLDYDAVLLDLRLCNEAPDVPTRDLSGYKALKRILRVDPTVQVVLFTASKNALHVREMLDLEIAGYYPKEDSLPDPPSANWVRLCEAFRAVLQNFYRREAYWALCLALSEASAQGWYQHGDPDGVEKLFAAVDHLQALVFLRETALPEPLELRMRRHVIDSAHAVMDASLRLQFPRAAREDTGELVKLVSPRTGAPRAARWLNQTRNDMVHRRNRADDRGGPHDHLWAVSAACAVVSGGRETGRTVFERISRHNWPDWVTG